MGADASALSPAFAGCPVPVLGDAQRKAFAQNGFLIIDDALDAAGVEHYRELLARLDREVAASHHGGGSRAMRRQAGDPLALRNAVAVAPELRELMVHPAAFPLLAQLMNGHLALTTSHVFLRPPTPDVEDAFKQIGWHRDGPAYPYGGGGLPPWLYTKIGWFLSDTTIADCGALRIVPGSHRYEGPAATAPGHWEPYGAVEVAVKPGTAIIFDNRVLHAVGPNRSAVTRENLYFGYCWRYLRPIDYTRQPPELLAEATPIQRQLLGGGDALSFYLPQAEDTPLVEWLEQLRA